MTLASGISCPYFIIVPKEFRVILEAFLADCKKADLPVENLAVLVRLTEVLNPFIKLEQGMRKGLNLCCDSLVDCFFSLLAFHRTESHAKFSSK